MAEFSWLDALKFGGASGLIAGATNQGIGYLRDIAGFRNTAKAQAEERAHQALMRSESEHVDARPAYLLLMEQVRERLNYEWGQAFGLEVDYHGDNLLPPMLNDAASMIRNLDRVATGHPTRQVRVAARSLHDKLDSIYNMIEGNTSAQPGVEDFSTWLQETDRIIEWIHTPSTRPPADFGAHS